MSNPRVFSAGPDFPGRIRVGDLNIDGSGDLMFTVTPANNKQLYGVPIILFNNKGKFNLHPDYADAYYTIKTDDEGHSKPLQNYKALSISFFDFEEIGNLGLWITEYNQNSVSILKGVFNFVGSEHFFIKIYGKI